MRALLCALTLLCGSSALPGVARPAPPASQPGVAAHDQGPGSRIHVLFTTDIYGRFAWPGCGARPAGRADLSHLVAAVQRKREQLRRSGEGEPVVLAGGSMIRPDVLGNHIFGEGQAWAGSAIKLLRKVGFDAVSVGPHDFGAEPSVLGNYLGRMHAAKIPLLASNVRCTRKGDLHCRYLGGPGGRRHVLLRRGGLRVGLLAVTREDMPVRILKRSRGTMTADDPVTSARRTIRLLRRQERADVVIVLSTLHLESNTPGPLITFVRELGADAPDLVLGDVMFHRDSADFIARIQSRLGSAIVGTDRFGQHLGHAVVHLGRGGGGAKVERIDVSVEPIGGVKPDRYDQPLVQDMLSELCRVLDRPLGRAALARPLSHADFTRYVMEIMRNREGAELAVLNDSSLADTSLPAGPLTHEQVLRALRTETELGSAWITGARLVTLLTPYVLGTRSGLRWVGLERRGTSWYVNQRPLIDGLHYRVAMTHFVAGGGDGLLKLVTERFRGSSFSLRRRVLDFFEQDGAAGQDGDPTIDLTTDFADPWDRWVLHAGSDLGLYVSNLSIGNGPGGARYNHPSLTSDNLTALSLDASLSLGASNRAHALEADIRLKYGQTWTRTAAQEAAGEGATSTEAQDQLRLDFLYRFNRLRNRQAPGTWYTPVPYAEATLLTELTANNTFTSSLGQEQTYRYLDLGGTLGVGLLPHPYLFLKTGVAFGGELLTPREELLDGKELRTGIYLGFKLRRLKLVAAPQHPLQLESRLDFYMTNLGDSFRKELTMESKLFFSLTPYLHVVASHNLYVYDTRCTEPVSRCIDGANDTSVANAVALGLNVLFDYRHQLF